MLNGCIFGNISNQKNIFSLLTSKVFDKHWTLKTLRYLYFSYLFFFSVCSSICIFTSSSTATNYFLSIYRLLFLINQLLRQKEIILLILSHQQSKTQRLSIYNYVKLQSTFSQWNEWPCYVFLLFDWLILHLAKGNYLCSCSPLFNCQGFTKCRITSKLVVIGWIRPDCKASRWETRRESCINMRTCRHLAHL